MRFNLVFFGCSAIQGALCEQRRRRHRVRTTDAPLQECRSCLACCLRISRTRCSTLYCFVGELAKMCATWNHHVNPWNCDVEGLTVCGRSIPLPVTGRTYVIYCLTRGQEDLGRFQASRQALTHEIGLVKRQEERRWRRQADR
jgi:hypothetical protein